MSGGIDWGAGQREFAAFCNSSCSPTPLTTAWAPPASCMDNWTPVRSYSVTGGYTVSLTRNVTATACAPTQWIPGCQSCPGIDDTSNISPGVCPEDAPAASTGIVGGVTTHYCCPFTNATFVQQASTAPARCFQTFSGLRTLSYDMTIYTSTWSYVTSGDAASPTESPSFTTWNTTSVTATAETVFFKLGTLEAEPFIVRFREAEFQTSSSPGSTSRGTAPPSDPAAATETKSKDQGLTAGAKAGIGVGATLGTLLLVAIGLVIFWLRKKGRKNSSGEKAVGTPEWNVEVDGTQTPGELPTKWSTAELHAQPMPPKELHASRYREVNPDEPAELGAAPTSGR